MIVSGLLSLIPVHYTTATHPSGFKGRQHIGHNFSGNALNTIVDTILGTALDTIVEGSYEALMVILLNIEIENRNLQTNNIRGTVREI